MVDAIAPTPKSSTVLGLPIHVLSNYSGWLFEQLQRRSGVHVVTLNAEMAIQAEKRPDLAAAIRKADLVIPDGAGVVLYLKLRGHRVQRCPGIELAESLLRQSVQDKQPHPVFFYGGAPEVNQAAVKRWQERVPGLTVAGTAHGYLAPDQQQQLLQELGDRQPHIILVGLGVPRQELWILEHRHRCPHAIWIGVGGSFDIWSGQKTRAPRWLRNNNLEWVYRLYQEPWRWRRMLALPQFAWRALVGGEPLS